ncbi:MAG: ABC transporter ATP-binding protein [Geothrix sp.]|uniref:ABC transporter ATP-binding protein n=1 Tax=Geothrix sp. TaxID=1962974 RepID=UPI00181DD152|nr:ABC transporter ATP-binding protein [Geothrix sp.]NWJ39767.1 ABC transporter ATP-binding protein [Geothrix sp.]WIL22219.1 MAG: ABC transporter ATP-binding protein [Geothrix sp.]
MAEPVLEVQGLTRRFGAFTAVSDLSFEVQGGEIFGFLGPNGAGKSTAIRMLCGVLAPSAGQARALGRDLFTEADQVRAHMGYMSQKSSLLTDLTVAENLRFFGGLYGLGGRVLASEVEFRLREMQVWEHRDLLVSTLSTGVRQRVALASATLHRPRILFLDEPTSGVDPLRRRLFWEAMDELVAEGMSILVTTHNLGEADQCDRLAFILGGRLMAYGRPRALKEALGRQVLELRTEQFRPLQAAARTHPEVLAAELLGRSVRLSLPAGLEPAGLLDRLRLEGFAFEALPPEPPSLEDLFVDLVQRSRVA